TAPVLEKDWLTGWYERGMSWDEKRMIEELRPTEADLNYNFRFWTADEGWFRGENKAKTSRQFVLTRSGDCMPDSFNFSYLRHLTSAPHWPPGRTPALAWGTKQAADNSVAWKHLGTEAFGGEGCHVLESAQKAIRLWIGQKSGRVRGILAWLNYPEPNELALLDDYREVSAGIWVPFREVRTLRWHSETIKVKSRI